MNKQAKASPTENMRNKYLISKSLRTFLISAILSGIIFQVYMTTDAFIVGQFVSPEAMSAVVVTNPLLCLIPTITALFGYDGKPFNPLVKRISESEVSDDEHLGLKIINSVKADITYKYMYGQNTSIVKLNINS